MSNALICIDFLPTILYKKLAKVLKKAPAADFSFRLLLTLVSKIRNEKDVRNATWLRR